MKLISPLPAAPQKRKKDVVVISDDDDFKQEERPKKKRKTYKLVPQKLDLGTSAMPPPPPPPLQPSTKPAQLQNRPSAAAGSQISSHVYAPCQQPTLEAYYTSKENVDVVYHKEDNGVVYSKDATICNFTLPAEQTEGTDIIQQAWSLASYM